MNSYNRLFARLRGEKVDRVPNLCILMSFAANYCNIPYRDFCIIPDRMVEANIRCHEDFGIDIVTTMSDPYGETHDYGALIEYPYDSNPICINPLIKSFDDIKKLKIRDIDETVRIKNRVKTIEQYKQSLKGECAIAGWVEGAVAEFCDLRGINEAMMDLVEDEMFVSEILEICTEQAILYAQAQILAGADIIGIGDAAVSLIGPDLYRKYALPYEKRLIKAIHDSNALVKLHICGNISTILDDIRTLGADIVDIDWMVDLSYASTVLDGISSVNGNIDPVGVIYEGNPEIIKAKVVECIENTNRFSLVSGGCEVPKGTPRQNLEAIKYTLLNYPFRY